MGQVSDLAKKLKIKASDTEVTEGWRTSSAGSSHSEILPSVKFYASPNSARCRKNYYGKLQRVGIAFAQVIDVPHSNTT